MLKSTLKKELEKYNYLVRAKITPSGCCVEYPKRLFPVYFDEKIENYVIEPKVGIKCINSNEEPTFREIPEYSFRLFIMSCIVYRCIRILEYDMLNIDYKGAKGESLDGIPEFICSLPTPTDIDQIDKENKLSDIWLKAYIMNFPDSFLSVAEGMGIKEGYEILHSTIQGDYYGS